MILVGVFTLYMAGDTAIHCYTQRVERKNLIECAHRQEKPHFRKLWFAIRFPAYMTIAPYIAAATTTFTGLFTSLAFSESIWRKNPTEKWTRRSEFCSVPADVVMLVGSLLGGWMPDKVTAQ
jgi:hypothetical protein